MLGPVPEVTENRRGIRQSPCLLEPAVQERGTAHAQINRMHEGHDKYYRT